MFSKNQSKNKLFPFLGSKMTIRGFTSENRKKKNYFRKKKVKVRLCVLLPFCGNNVCFYFVFVKEKKFTSEKRK